MSNHWLVYWRKEQIQTATSERLLYHAASEQFDRVVRGDTVWISGPSESSRLVTVGPLEVHDVVSQKEAEHRYGRKFWKARYHAVAKPGKETAGREVSLEPIVGDLRFQSQRSLRLHIEMPFGQQLQRIRLLTQSSANLLRRVWNSKVASAAAKFGRLQRQFDQLGALDARVTILRRREQAFLRDYLFGSNTVGTCAVCGSTLPRALIVAAHIKPRARCTDLERRDFVNNVIPMCQLGCDALFERGLVVVEEGKVKVRVNHSANDLLGRLCHNVNGRLTDAWKRGRIRYFRWHASHLSDDLD